jgi:hypothetical protein
MEVLGRMLTARLVTAADVPALQAETQMDPGSPSLETFFTTGARARRDVADLFDMGTGDSHEFLLVRANAYFEEYRRVA